MKKSDEEEKKEVLKSSLEKGLDVRNLFTHEIKTLHTWNFPVGRT